MNTKNFLTAVLILSTMMITDGDSANSLNSTDKTDTLAQLGSSDDWEKNDIRQEDESPDLLAKDIRTRENLVDKLLEEINKTKNPHEVKKLFNEIAVQCQEIVFQCDKIFEKDSSTIYDKEIAITHWGKAIGSMKEATSEVKCKKLQYMLAKSHRKNELLKSRNKALAALPKEILQAINEALEKSQKTNKRLKSKKENKRFTSLNKIFIKLRKENKQLKLRNRANEKFISTIHQNMNMLTPNVRQLVQKTHPKSWKQKTIYPRKNFDASHCNPTPKSINNDFPSCPIM